MKGKTVVGALCAFLFVVLVSLQGRLWQSVHVFESMLPKFIDPQRHQNLANASTIASLPLSFQSALVSVDFEKMRREALYDPKAIFLSRQTRPSFDRDFKNPCWFYGRDSASLACLPYFYLAGFPKSGTTDLYSRLVQHPFIVRGRRKEPHHVTRGQFYGKTCDRSSFGVNAHTSCQIMRYATQFFDASLEGIRNTETDNIDWTVFEENTPKDTGYRYPAITVDASASTAWDNSNGHHIIRDIPMPEHLIAHNSSIIDWIATMNPNVRIVIIMREPISRAYSDYNYFNKGTTPELFDTQVDKSLQNFHQCTTSGASQLWCAMKLHGQASVRLHIGLYHLYIEELFVRLPRDRIHILRSEDYHDQMALHLRDIFHFLEIPQLKEEAMESVLKTDQKNVNHKQMDPMLPTTWKKLVKFYQPFNKKLAKLLNNEAFLWEDVYSKHKS